MNSARLQIERFLPATPARVFAAFTEPRHLMAWWGVTAEHEATLAEVDLRVGGAYRLGVRAPTGAEFVVGGVFVEITPPQRLSYTWAWEHEVPSSGDAAERGDGPTSNTSVVTLEFEQRDGGTHLVLTHERLADQTSADGHRDGWNGSLECLAEYLQRSCAS